MSSDTQEINYEKPKKVKKKKRSPSPIKEKEQSKKSRKDNNNSDSENKIKKRKDRSLSRDDHSDRSYKKKHYDDDDDDNWNKYTRNNVRVGSRYYEPYRQEVCEIKKVEPAKPRVQKKEMDILTRSGGAYIPPAKLKMLQAQITDKSSAAYQRIAWEALKKSIHGHINKVNTTNIGIIVRELFKENIVRGRGLLCRSIIQAQAASPTFTHVYAALVSVINCKFPNIGELLLKRLIIQFRRGFKRNDKSICISAASFIAHLVNQNVAHEILALELLTLLIESPTNDSVEVAIAFLKESGMKLTQVSKKGLQAIFEMLRNILHEGNLEKRVRYMIEVIFQIRKDNFEAHEAVTSELDIVEENDQITHVISLDEIKDGEDILNVFKLDTEYEANELKYTTLKKEILDESSDESGSGEDDDGSDSSEDEGADGVDKEKEEGVIIDQTETNLVALRRTIYLTIQSSVDFEECAHKLLRMELKPGQESELCHMLLDSCAELRTYEKFFGLLAQRFCVINKIFVGPFENIFGLTYSTIHRLDTNKLRNVAKFFAHLLFTDAISWTVLEKIRLNEEETTSSSRIFIKILFQELSEYMGLTKLNERVKDPTMQSAFDGLFPRDNPKNTRFAINFFTSIGLGGLTDDLREHLKALPKVPIITRIAQNLSSTSSDSSSSDSGSSSSSSGTSSSSSSSSDSSDSESDDGKKKKKKTLTKNKKINESAKKNKSKEKSKDSNKSKNSKEGKSKKHNEDDNDDDDDDVVFLKQKKNKEHLIKKEPKEEDNDDVMFDKNKRRFGDCRERREYYDEEVDNVREQRRNYYDQQTRNRDRAHDDKSRGMGKRREYDEGRMKEKERRKESSNDKYTERNRFDKRARKESENDKYINKNRYDERTRKESENDKNRNKYEDKGRKESVNEKHIERKKYDEKERYRENDEKERYRESDRKKENKHREKERDRDHNSEKSRRK